MNSILSAATSSAWLDFLGPVALKGAGLLATALLAGIALRRVSAAQRYVLWFSAVLAIGALTIAAPLLPAWRVLPARDVPVVELPVEIEETSVVVEEPPSVQTAAPLLPPVVLNEPAPAPPPTFRRPEIAWLDVAASLPLVWLVIAAALCVRLVISGVRLGVLRRRCAAREVPPMLNDALAEFAAEVGIAAPRLLIGPAGSVPMVWGIAHACLLLPADADEWPEEKLRAVLLHELAHLKRRDPSALLVAQIAQALHWFNPLAWLTVRSLRADQERACDDAVLRHGIRASDYAQHLLDISHHHRLAPGLGLCALAMARSSPVETRLAAILDSRIRREASSRATLVASLVIAAVIAMPLAMVANEAAKGLRGRILDRHGMVLAESTKEKVRQYPLKTLAAHVIGYTGRTGPKDDTPAGRAAMEKQHDGALRQGKDVALSLDARVQALSIRAMKDAGVSRGAVVILDPRTGEVVGSVSVPSYDLNRFVPSLSLESWDTYHKDKSLPLFDRCLRGQYSPGGTAIPFTALTGIAAGVGEKRFNCTGSVVYGDKSFRCWISGVNGVGHGTLGMAQAIESSCSCYWYQSGTAAGMEAFVKMARLIGIGEATGVIEGESPGAPPGPAWHPTSGNIAGLAIGQGTLRTTPLQLAVLAATVGNGGKVPKPTLLRLDHDAKPSWRADLTAEGLPAKQIEQIREGMRLVVNGDAGTGKPARSERCVIAGKTGTVQIRRMIDGKEVKDNQVWFIGFAPFEKPTLAFAVLVEGGKSGGGDCAPIAKRIVEETLALPADGSGKVEPVEEQAGHFNQIEPVTEEEVRKAQAMGKPGSPAIDDDAAKTVKPTADSAASTSGKATPAPNSNWRMIRHDGRDHVTLENVKTFYRFDSLLRNGNALALRTSRVILKTEVGSREMLINGVKFVLSDPVVEIEGNPSVSQLDLTRLIDPVLRPSYIKNASAFDTVVIDPGHGGHDAGAKGVYGLEKDLTLKLGLALKAELLQRGIKVVMTRETDDFKAEALRVKLANDTPGSILISLHFNSGDEDATGVETLALTPQAGADPALNSQNIALATAIHARVVTQYKLTDRGVKRAPWTSLLGCARPGILFEGGFITNGAEARMIASETYRKALSSSMADGVVSYKKALRVVNPIPAKPKDTKDGQASAVPQTKEDAAAEPLRRAEAKEYAFLKTRLDEVLGLLAADSGIKFISMPEDAPELKRLITHKITASPFSVMETFCRANGLRLVLDGDIWVLRPSNDPELVGKTYALPPTKAKPDTILKDIRSILDLHSSDSTSGSTTADPKAKKSDADSAETKVIFKQEENSFYVVATRLQHTWVEGYFEGLSRVSKNPIVAPKGERKQEKSPTDASANSDEETQRRWQTLQRECGLSDLPPGKTKLRSELAGSGFPRAIVVTFTAPQAAARAWLASCPIQVPPPSIKPKAVWPVNGLLDANPLAVMQEQQRTEPLSMMKNWPVEPSAGFKGIYPVFSLRGQCEITVGAPDRETVEVEIRQWRRSIRL